MPTPALKPRREMILGSSPTEPKEIVQLLEKAATEDMVREYRRSLDPSYKGDPGKEDKGWKEVIYGTLETLVRNHGGRAVFTRSEKKEKEFMLDFVGLDEQNGAFGRAILGVECEWWKGRKELLRNFRKLLFFKAPLKVLVYSCLDDCSEKDREVEREEIRGCIKRFEQHVKGECYLIIEFIKRNGLWKQEARVWYAEQNGAEPALRMI